MASKRNTICHLRYDFDDSIFAIVFAYINAECNSQFYPKKVSGTNKGKKKKNVKFIQDSRTNFQLRLAELDENGKIIRYVNNN